MVTFAQAQPGIFAGESGGDYNALYGYQNRPGGSFANTRLTDMSVGDVIDFTNPRGDYAAYVRGQVGRTATPVGAYQVVGTTLRGAVDALGIDPSTPFNQATQDRIGEYIFNTQGTGAWEGYRGPQAGGQGMDQGIMAQSFVEQQPQQQQQPQDPMSNLSRSQRMMLGFAALRDAAASLEGQQSSFFSDAFGGIQTRQMQQQQLDVRRTEQERLRRQGDLQNRIAMTNSLGELEQRISGYTMLGQQPPANLVQLRDMLVQQLAPAGGGMPATGGASVMPVSGAATPTEATAPTPTGVTPQGEQPMSTSDMIAGIDSELDRLTQFVGLPGSEGAADRISALEGQRERLVTQLEAERTAEQAGSVQERQSAFLSPRIDSAIDYLIQGTDEQGNPIFNPQVATRIGREASSFIQPQDYQEYVGNLNSIANTYTFENLMRIRAAGALPGPISNVELQRIADLAGQLNPEDPRGTARTLQELRAEVRNTMRNAELREQGVLGMDQDASEIGVSEGQAPTTGAATHRFNVETGEFEVIQ